MMVFHLGLLIAVASALPTGTALAATADQGHVASATLVALGAVIVGLVGLHRFNTVPPARPSLPDNLPSALRALRIAFQIKDEPAPGLFPPPGANTTFFKFSLYRGAYALTGILVYLVIILVPGLAAELDAILHGWGNGTLGLQHAGPIVVAVLVAVVFPMIPPLRAAERAIRRTLYERACIPAQQLRERSRLKNAEYEVDPATLRRVTRELVAEGFDGADFCIDASPTTRSLWTKAAVLMAHIHGWQGEDRYKTAFALLRERDGVTPSIDRLNHVYEALKGDARSCLTALRTQRHEPETQAREEAFRRHTKQLLDGIYDMLSRVSLHSHYTERERVARPRAIGFQLSVMEGGPLPDANDMATLAAILTIVAVLPLSARLGLSHAVVIAAQVYAAVLVPVVIAARYPPFTKARESGTPALAFPMVAGVLGGTVAAAVAVLHRSWTWDPGLSFDLVAGWNSYAGRSYPWSFLLGLIAALTAWRMTAGTYPETAHLRGLARVRAWGSVQDATISIAASVALVMLYVRPKLAELSGNPAGAGDWTPLIISAAIAGSVGFFVPTWYKANARRTKTSETRAEPVPPMVRLVS